MQYKSYFKMLLEKVSQFHALNPASVILLGLLNGIFIVIFNEYRPLIISISIILSIVLFFCSRHITIKFLLSLLIGIGIILFHTRASINTYLKKLPNKNCGGIIIAKISDPTATGKSVPWLNQLKYVKAQILLFKYTRIGNWETVNGKVLISVPNALKTRIKYGDLLLCSGYFKIIDPPKTPGLFSYKKHLLSQGIQRIFKAKKIKSLKELPINMNESFISNFTYSFNSTIFYIRNFLMNKMTDGMNIKYRRFLASILFGCRQGLSYQTKQDFKRSGVMHVFAISGLHVGMLAINLFIIFSFLPYRYRHLATVIILFCYVLSTGMQASALRAFIMIGVWSLHKAAFRSISTINTLFIAAVISLLLNPLNIYGMGFIYSFTIVFYLIISWGNIQIYKKCLSINHFFIHHTEQGKYILTQKLKIWTFNIFATTTVCWLTSVGLNMLFGNYFIPGGILFNFLILPFVWILFLLNAINLFICFLTDKLSMCIELIMKIINFLAQTGGEFAGAFTPSHLPTIFACIYLILLLLLFITKRKNISIGLMAGILLIIIYWKILDINYKGQIIILNGGKSSLPTFLCIPPYKSGALLINIGSYPRSTIIREALKKVGCTTIDILVIGKNQDSYKGLKRLANSCNVNEIIFPLNGKNGYYLKKVLSTLKTQSTFFRKLNTSIQTNKGNYTFTNTLFNYNTIKGKHLDFNLYRPEFNLSIISNKKNEFSVTNIIIKINSIKYNLKLNNSAFIKIYSFENM